MSADVEALIAEAVADFRRALPSRVARIAALVSDPVGLRAEAHALAGAAGCYGFDAVSEAARAVEDDGAVALPSLIVVAEACR
jgi:HPt (histidine-containing phosphotransfer) domain-containing protein